MHAMPKVAMKIAVAIAVVALMLAGLGGGLQRAGSAELAVLPSTAAALHAWLMISAFFGTVIGIERAVALKWWPAWVAPLASALGGWCLLAAQVQVGGWALLLGSVLFAAGSARVVLQQAVAHHVLLLVAALCWVAANLRFALGMMDDATLAMGLAYLVLTIAAERLEMTRLMQRKPLALAAFAGFVSLLLLALALLWGSADGSSHARALATTAYGAALSLLALCRLAGHAGPRAPHHPPAQGLHALHGRVRCWAGYAWLAVWAAWPGSGMALRQPGWRDAALHALGLGFVISMVMAHAPVILPAVARVKLRLQRRCSMLPLALLHASLAVAFAGRDRTARSTQRTGRPAQRLGHRRLRPHHPARRAAGPALQPAVHTSAHAPMSTLLGIDEPPRPLPPKGYALWALGFRPFYLFAAVFSALSIVLWALQFSGVIALPYLRGPLWHAHEMLFGYTLAVIVGFLFTAGQQLERPAHAHRAARWRRWWRCGWPGG
jgi:hypothetical protein